MYQKKHAQILAHLSVDQVFKEICDEIEKKGKYQFPVATKKVYEDLIEAIVYQQVSIKAAKTVFGRIKEYFGGFIPPSEEMRLVPQDSLRGLGLSGRKAAYVIHIAQFFDARKLRDQDFLEMPDEEIIKLLTQIKGVGVWTVQMILIFSLGRPDVFPRLDLGIQQAMMERYQFQLDNKQRLLKMDQIASLWKPYRSYATLLLWRWKRIQMGIDY
jgi:DNA-3-methyladenine glycosylase II